MIAQVPSFDFFFSKKKHTLTLLSDFMQFEYILCFSNIQAIIIP